MMAAQRGTPCRALAALLEGLAPPGSLREVGVSGLELDSHLVRSGGLFVARAGARAHGMDHLAEALGRGAAAVLAYLAVRVLRGLPTSAPSTTGCRAPVSGGRVSRP